MKVRITADNDEQGWLDAFGGQGYTNGEILEMNKDEFEHLERRVNDFNYFDAQGPAIDLEIIDDKS